MVHSEMQKGKVSEEGFKYTKEGVEALALRHILRLYKLIENRKLKNRVTEDKISCRTVCVCVDRKTGRVSIGFSNKNWGNKTVKGESFDFGYNPSKVINKKTSEIIVDIRLKNTLTNFGESKTNWDLDNCCEFFSINRCMLKGSCIEDLHIVTYSNKGKNKFQWKEPCKNCRELYKNAHFVKFEGSLKDLAAK